jgi:hypothetical protein
MKMEWSPIETAPKTSDVLLWWPHWSNRPTIGYWKFDRWMAENALQDSVGFLGPQPTHWMPLPAPPELQAASDQAINPASTHRARRASEAIDLLISHYSGLEDQWREEVKSGPRSEIWQARALAKLEMAHDAKIFLHQIRALVPGESPL